MSGVPLARAAISKLDGVCAASGPHETQAQSNSKPNFRVVLPDPESLRLLMCNAA
jgi:hypothetical protein